MSASVLQKPAAPTSNLLKFLRSQKDGIPFFSSNCLGERPLHVTHCSPARAWPAAIRPRSPCKGRMRAMTTVPAATDALESSIGLVSSLFPRSRRRQNPASHRDGDLPPSLHAFPVAKAELKREPRAYSTSSIRRSIGKWMNIRSRARNRQPLQPDDLPGLAGFLDDNASFGRTLGGRPANELKLRCTEFDESGNVTLVNGEFKKSELIQKYGLLPRDLRKIDSSLLPNILVRPSAILINLLHLRVLIKHNRVLVFDAYGSTDSYTQSLFMYDLGGKLRSPEATSRAISASPIANALPYEFRALEAVLISVTSGLEGEFEGVREPVVRVLRELEEDIDRDKLRHLLIYSKKLGTFEQKARLVRDAIDDLLEADDDLSDMYLSEKAAGNRRSEHDHTEVEMLLESYHKVCDEIVQVSGNIVSNIRNTEEIVKAILDANRNSLMLLDLKFSIGTLGLGGGTFVAALYGMNLKNFIEESDFGFWGVSAWCTVFSVIVCYIGLKKLRQVQRLSMWGSERQDPAHVRGKTGWARMSDHSVGDAIGAGRRERLKGSKETYTHEKEAKDGRGDGTTPWTTSTLSSSRKTPSQQPERAELK